MYVATVPVKMKFLKSTTLSCADLLIGKQTAKKNYQLELGLPLAV